MKIKSCSRLVTLVVTMSLAAFTCVKASNEKTSDSGPNDTYSVPELCIIANSTLTSDENFIASYTIAINDPEEQDTCATIDAGADSVTICSSNIVGLQAVFGDAATSAQWVGGAGNFNPGRTIVNGNNIDYTPDPSEYGTTLTLYAVTNDPGNGCGAATDSIKITIIDDPLLSVTPTIVFNTCPSLSIDLSIDVTVTDLNSTTGTLSYEDDTFTPLGGPIVSPAIGVPTIFYIRKTTAQGCDDFEPVTVFISSCPTCVPPDLNGTTSSTSCPGGNDGSINITVSGGTTPYTYQWSNGVTTEDISNLMAGTYTVTVTDAQPCDTIMSFTVTDGSGGVTANAGGDQSFCSFGINGVGTVGLAGSVGGGGNPVWVGGLGNFDPNRFDVNALYTPDSSEYGSTVTLTLVATDPSGTCPSDSDDVVLTVLLAPNVSGPATASNTCPATDLDLATLPFIDANGVTGAQFWFDAAGNQLGSTVVSPPVGVPTIYVVRSITFTTPTCFDFDTVTVVITNC
ncbi:MAG: hypothetical protein HKN22_05605, partial [Bacteroidia bacterium]|nr:hypothetical protein [Bacteroidia bacterium]